jgi:DNA-directed RNA polymerase beta subunit
LLVYEAEETHEINCISIPNFQSYHQTFGYRNVFNNAAMNLLRPGAYIPAGTIFADSPGVGKNTNYMFGTELETAFMSLPATSEDGVIISRSALEKLTYHTFEVRKVNFGSNMYPLNLYGTKTMYKPFPEIGEYIRDDGMLMKFRTYESDLVPVEMSIHDVMEPDNYFDTALYTKAGRGKVVDIQVIANNNSSRQLPDAMTEQLSKYQRALYRYHREIVELDQSLRLNHRKKFGSQSKLRVSPNFHRLVVESMAITNYFPAGVSNRHSLNLLERKEPIDEYRVEFTIEYEVTPGIGSKMTDCHGGKGVIVLVEEPENMPVDEAGNRAEVIMDSLATLNRMNLARSYEHYHGAAARDVSVEVRKLLGLSKGVSMERLELLDPQLIFAAHQYILRYYETISTRQFEFYRDLPKEKIIEHVFDVVNEGIYPYMPTDNDKDPVETARIVEQKFKPVYGPVSYVGNSGERHTTRDKVRIGPMYFMLLDKTATEWASTSTGRLQHFGVLTTMTKSEKFSSPWRNNPTRTIGESEARIYRAVTSPYVIAELLDRSNNPTTQKNIVQNLLMAEKPGNIDEVVDRDFISYGNSRSLQNVKHIMHCAGFTVAYKPEKL